MGAIEKFQEIYENRHDYGRDWKARHPEGKMLGYFCTYLPEEITYAAGILPVRLLGSHEIEDDSAPHIFPMFCPHCRDVLAQGLQGRYDYLDGIGAANCCMHMLQAFESWAFHKNTTHFRVDMPSTTQGPHSRNHLRRELECFKTEDIEKWAGKEITDDALDYAIEVYNENRRLMRQVYELRKAERPPITGLESMYMVVSSQFMDKAEHNQLIKEALGELKNRKLDRETGTRLMIVGSENDDVEFIGMVEQKMVLPATVVIDDHCTGSRYFWNEVIPETDRLQAIASRYIDRPACPNKDWPEHRRFPHILQLAKEWRAEGAITIQQKFCDPHELDIPSLREYLKENGVPTYLLELDVTVPIGQFSTRVEAFIESLMTDIV
ncbi:MAG: benzoyl-CoA reductase, bzd-type, subunit N [Syntrophales bacterium]|nr:benzoyl-CoA reductase, bzd-type, subunit N [Syntrophales bacterium]